MRPTPKQIAEARAWFAGDGKRTLAHIAANFPESYGAIMTLRAATEPQTDEEIESAIEEYAGYDPGTSLWCNGFRAGARHFFGPVKP